MAAEIGLDLSLGELYLLCEISSLPPPPVLTEAPWNGQDTATADLLRGAGHAALVARHVLDDASGGDRVNPAVLAVLEVLCLPKAVIRMSHASEGRERVRFVAVVEKAAVEQIELRGNVIRLVPMVIDDLVDRVVDFSDPAMPAGASDATTIPLAVLEACARRAGAGDAPGAAGELVRAGLSPESATALAEAIADPITTVRLEVVREASPDGVSVIEIGWVETSAGPWTVSRPQTAATGDETVVCSPVTRRNIAESLRTALPESIRAGIGRFT